MTTNMLVPITIDYGLPIPSLIAPLTGDGDALLPVLETARNSVRERLRDFAQSPDFGAKMELTFEQGLNIADFQEAWAASEVRFPTIEIRSSTELGGALGAFAQSTGKIYLAQELLETQPLEQVVSVLSEEYGHFVDIQISAVDAEKPLENSSSILTAVGSNSQYCLQS